MRLLIEQRDVILGAMKVREDFVVIWRPERDIAPPVVLSFDNFCKISIHYQRF